MAPQGLFDNFREVSYSPQTGVTFSFDLLTGDSRDITNRDMVQLQWQGTNGSRGAISLSVRRDYTTRIVKRYRFTVTPTQLPEGPLNLTLSLKLQCLLYSSYSCSLYRNRNSPSCTCRQWQYQGNSETIFMSAKQGMTNNVLAIHWAIVVTVTCCHSNICDLPRGMNPLRMYCVILPECGSLCITTSYLYRI